MAATEAGSWAARALDDLYRHHSGDVYRYAYAVLGNRADAEDVTQTTFMNALAALERGERPRKPGNWLLAIAHNVVRQRWRHARARPAEVELDAERTPAAEDNAAGPSVSEMVKALGRIPASQREAIVMREFEGRSYTEIAEILGITTTALETLLFRARKSLAEELDNLVTCDLAERAISRQLDGRLGRKERRRLATHVRECPACARFELVQRRSRKAFKGLAILPLPATLTLFKGTHSAAAASLPRSGRAAGGGGAAAGGTATAGGLAVGGLAVKAAAVVAAVGVAGGVGYKGVQEVRQATASPGPARAKEAAARADRVAATPIGKTQHTAQPPHAHSRPLDGTKQKRRAIPTPVAAAPVASGNVREHAPRGAQATVVTSRGDAATSPGNGSRRGPSPNSNGAAKQAGDTATTLRSERGQTPSASVPKPKAVKGPKSKEHGGRASESPAATAPGQVKKTGEAHAAEEKAAGTDKEPKDPKTDKPAEPKAKEQEPKAKEQEPPAAAEPPTAPAPEDAAPDPTVAEAGAAHANNSNAGPKT